MTKGSTLASLSLFFRSDLIYSRQRFQSLVVFVISAISAVVIAVSPAVAGEEKIDADKVPQSVLNLDLCTLAYQLYHQSLCLPLDPWYDMMSRMGSDRRENICKFTHEYSANLGDGLYAGPNSVRGWSNTNLRLDPVLTNYKHIDAKLPTFNRDGEIFLAVQAPGYITENIRNIEGVRYKSQPTQYPYMDIERFPIREYPTGEDHMIVFEGGTGVYGNPDSSSAGDTTAPSWSPMGFVLMHKTATGYDAHIVFRGSRSGSSLMKTVLKAQDVIGEAKGNPDWITDLRGSKQIQSPLLSKVGTVTEGFGNSLPTMLGPITSACKYLEAKYPAPEHIYVTGHSLGAGLGSQFVGAVLQGAYGDELRSQVKSWPWDKTILYAYAQPIPGDPAWAAAFDKASPYSQHYWVSGDSVVEATSGFVVGLLIDKGEHAGVQHKLEEVAFSKDNPHEVFIIRAAILRELAKDPTGNAALIESLKQDSTWGYYDNFTSMINGQAKNYKLQGAPAINMIKAKDLKQILQNGNFSVEFERWLENSYARMIADKSSYIGPKFQSTLDERKQLVLDTVQAMRKPAVGDNSQDMDNLEKAFAAIDDNLGLTNEERWIYCAMLLSRLENSSLTVADLMSKQSMKSCLESKFDE